VLLGELDHAVRDQQNEDDEEVWPMTEHPRQDHCDFDHPRDRTPEVGEEFEQRIALLLFDLIGSIPDKSLLGVGCSESIRGVPKPLLHLGERNGLQIIARRQH